RALALAAQDRVRRAWGGPAEFLGRDLADAAVDSGLLEDRSRELGPRALALRGHVPDTAGQVEQLARRLGEVAHVGRRASLVGDHAHLVPLCAEPQQRPNEVRAAPPEQTRAAYASPLAYLTLAVELRPAVCRERPRLVGL